jgi:hypothetical protein
MIILSYFFKKKFEIALCVFCSIIIIIIRIKVGCKKYQNNLLYKVSLFCFAGIFSVFKLIPQVADDCSINAASIIYLLIAFT